jgi:hypothetical protein
MFKSILWRHRGRIFLTSLLLFLFLAVVDLGLEAAAKLRVARRQRDAVAATRGLKWQVYYEKQFYQGGMSPVRKRPTPPPRYQWLRKWLGDDLFEPVTRISIHCASDASDETMIHFASLPNLEDVRIDHVPVTDSGIGQLAGLTKLQVLALSEVPISDAALDPLSRLPSLKHLGLERTRIGDGALLYVGRITQLRSLSLAKTRITDAGLAQVSGLHQLERLDLHNTHITDAGLAHLVGLIHLEHLNLWFTNITDDGLNKLHGMTSLKYLLLRGTRTTAEGVAAIKQSLPACQVVWFPDEDDFGPDADPLKELDIPEPDLSPPPPGPEN